MPVADGEIVQYDIPEEYKTLLTKEILEQFARNLLAVFPQCDDAYTLFFLESTKGWVDAFSRAVNVHASNNKYRELLDYYFELEWYDFDMFNDELLDLMIEFGILPGFDDSDENETS